MSSENESTSGFHSFRQMSSKEKTDLKRIQGQISCAECCRLKYKFLADLKGAMTSDVAALRRRIRQLEDALSALQATTSSEPHSLLAESLCLPKAELRKNSYPEDVETSDMADALGTLTLGKLGDARYLGRSAGSESLLEDSPEVVASPTTYGFVPSNHIAQLVNSFPFLSDNTWDVESSVKILLSHLPQKEHRESVKWGLDDKTIQRRRTIFWELYTFDGLTSLALGRPPALFTAHSNTPLPIDTDDGVDDEGNLEPGFHHWRMTFSRDVITAVAKVTLSPGMPDYQSILDLDQLVREHPLPREYDPIHSLSLSLEKNSPATSVDEEEEQVGYEASMIALKGLHLNQFRA
ncbi:hypothetical protein LENED_002172 [Lentinula edodes]|uniref:Xylanolytic transcriptional activator regulatory domain-containing protein n=1 Tax=Lentinula edodes TaxID=5353 RepID=A0A1Q3E065_LENED|nr:hypothetical protein LENED_002172 [Lentinula edodes]